MSRTLVRESAIYGLGTLLTRSIGLILIPLYTHYLTVSEYGALALLNLILVLTSFLTLMGISSGAMRHYYDNNASEEYRKEVYGNAVIILILFPPLILALLGAISYPLFDRYLSNIPFFPLILTVLLTGLFTPIIKLLIGFFRVQQRPVAFIIFNVCFFIIQSLLIIIALAVFNLGLKGQIYSQLIANFIFWIVAISILLRYSRPKFSIDMMKKLMVFGIPMIPFFIFMWINNAAGRFLLEQAETLERVGIFSLAAQFGGIILLFGVALDNALSPHFFRTGNKPEGPVALGRLITQYVALFGILALAINVLSPPVILLITEPSYHEAIQYIAPLTFAYWLFICANPIIWSLTYSKRTGILSVTRTISSVIFVILLIIFLWYFKLGIMGVILSMVTANLATIIIGYSFSQREFRLIFNYKQLLTVIIIIFTGGIIINMLPASTLDIQSNGIRILVFLITIAIPVRILRLHKILTAFNKG